jgi:membrane protein
VDLPQGLTRRVARLVAERPLVAVALRSLQRYLAIDGTQRSLVLAGQAFSALIPLLIVLSTILSSNGGEQLAQRINARFRLSGNGADAVRTLFDQPAGAAQTVTVGSALLLIISGLSCARTMQRTYEVAWRLPPRGVRGTLGGAGALVLLLTQILLLSLLAGFLRQAPAGSVLEFLVRATASSALWLALQHLFLGGRVTWRRLLPGAITAGVGQQGVAALSTLWIPGVIQSNASRYGAIGVSFALLSWLVLISVVLVAAAVVSVELGGGPALPPPAPGHAHGLFSTLAGLLGADDGPSEDRAQAAAAGDRPDRPTPDSADAAVEGSTADLFVLGFPTKEKAEAVLAISRDPQKRELPDLENAALVWRTSDGTVEVQQAYSPVAAGVAGGALWGILFGVLFRMPGFGLALGAASGALAGTLTEVGIDESFRKEVTASLTPGTAAVFALVPRGTADRLPASLLPYHPTVIRTSLSIQDEAELVRRLQEAQAEVQAHPQGR